MKLIMVDVSLALLEPDYKEWRRDAYKIRGSLFIKQIPYCVYAQKIS